MNPQIIYMMMFLPSVFGLVSLGHGIVKFFAHEEDWIQNIVLGLILLAASVMAGVFFL